MQSLAHHRCFNHALREAVVRCPECGRFFCRECVTEHDDRMVCTSCLKRLAGVPLTKRPAFVRGVRFVQAAAGIMVLWFFFFLIGEALLKIPASVHEGTLWRASGSDNE